MLVESDLAYIAGVIDSDGYIGLVKQREYRRKNGQTDSFRPTVVISQVQMNAINFIQDRFHGRFHIVNRDKSKNWKKIYIWGLYKRSLVAEFLGSILPYLKIKKIQAELVIQFCSIREAVLSDWSGRDKRGRPRRSSKYTYSNVEREMWLRIKKLNQTGVYDESSSNS